jgi:hypothetical protein
MLEESLTKAEFMLKMECDIASARGWSEERKQAAKDAIPGWENRVAELKRLLRQ